MGRGGAVQTIPAGVRLVMLDFYGTVVSHHDFRPRRGMEELLRHLEGRPVPVVVCSDSRESMIKDILARHDFSRYFQKVYGSLNLVRDGSWLCKDLERICQDFSVQPKQAVLIGDNEGGLDRRSAERYGVPFIPVPEHPSFDFARLIAAKEDYSGTSGHQR